MVLIILLVVYFIPSIVALTNDNKRNKKPAIVLNIFLGWTAIGWIIALVMAVSDDK